MLQPESLSALVATVLTWAPGLILGITLHEAAHAYAAKRCGDNTAYALGRVTLNPVKHIDPIGTLLLPIVMGVMTAGSFIFGYAKPVPVNFARLDDPKWDAVRVAAAGPAANFVIAVLAVFLLHFAILLPAMPATLSVQVLAAAIQINVLLMVFNLLPLLPLDGGRIVHALLPYEAARTFAQTERFGFFIVMGLALTGILFTIIGPIMRAITLFLIRFAPVG